VNMMKRRGAAIAGALALALVAAACGSDNSSGSSSGATTAATTNAAATTAAGGATTTSGGAATTAGGSSGSVDPSLSGSLFVSGSSTVEPISTAVAKRFNAQAKNVAVQVEGPGTGDGFAKFCNGETDISDASRAITKKEVDACQAKGIEFVELKVAIDGLSVVTSKADTALTCLSFTDLYALLGPDATGVNNWKEADAKAAEYDATLAGKYGKLHTPYPDAPLTVTAPGEESGTFDSFVEIVIAKVGTDLGVEDATVRPDYTASPNDNVIVEGIAKNDTSLGWVGFAFVEENLDKIKPLEVDGGKGCVAPSDATISSAQYPIARNLYIYVNKAKADSNPAVSAYVDFYLTQLGDSGVVGNDLAQGQVPYVKITADDVAKTQAVWAAQTTGTRDGGK
jgi:phosphate transport system substrate-binding protein